MYWQEQRKSLPTSTNAAGFKIPSGMQITDTQRVPARARTYLKSPHPDPSPVRTGEGRLNWIRLDESSCCNKTQDEFLKAIKHVYRYGRR
jgi:hypothetical protein